MGLRIAIVAAVTVAACTSDGGARTAGPDMDASTTLPAGGTGGGSAMDGGGGASGRGDGSVTTLPVDGRVPDGAAEADGSSLDASQDGSTDSGVGIVIRPEGGLGCQGDSYTAVPAGACAFELPPVDGGAPLNLINVAQGGVYWAAVGSSSDCGNAYAWYYDDAAGPTAIVLCPTACGALGAGPALEIILGCYTIVLE